MDTLRYPSRSALNRVKKIRIKVDTSGSVPALIDKIIKQLAGGALVKAGGSIAAVYGLEEYDAILRCKVSAMPVHLDVRNRPLAHAYLLHFDLLTTVSSLPEDELVAIWTQVEYGLSENSLLYTALTEKTKEWCELLVSEIKG